MQEDPAKMKCPARKWTKWAGIATFMFFLVKGLVWLGLIAGAYFFATSE
jgi:hypothetical protein